MATRMSLPTAIAFLQQSEEQLNIRFDFYSKRVVDTRTHLIVGEFNKLHTGANRGRVYISPHALVTIRTRMEEIEDFATTDKLVRDAMVICYEELEGKFIKANDGMPSWMRGNAIEGERP